MKDDAGESSGGAGAGGFSPSGPVTVKKYANRRLYNTATSSYITLENLAAMVREGQDFVVQDARTGEDITRTVLTQIIFEEESRGAAPMLPTNFLRQLIRLYGDTLQGYVPGYLEMTMQSFMRNQEVFRSQLERSFGKAPGYQQFEAVTRANMEMFRSAMELFKPFTKPLTDAAPEAGPSPEPAPKAAPGPQRGDDVAELRRQLAEMQRQVDKLSE